MSQSHKGSIAKKHAQKAEMAAARLNKEADKAMGLNSAMKAAIKGDVLLCTECKANKLGPKDACRCKGGATKPPGGFNSVPILIEAAKARFKLQKEEQKKQAKLGQEAVLKEREKKKKDQKENPYGDPNLVLGSLEYKLSLEFGEHEQTQTVTFSSASSLGLSIEANVVNKEGKPKTQANKLKVQVGWVMGSVNGEVLPRDKPGILAAVKAAVAAAKEGDGKIDVEFRIPRQNVSPPRTYCPHCNYFKPDYEFEQEQLDEPNGPGKQKCKKCNGFVEAEDY